MRINEDRLARDGFKVEGSPKKGVDCLLVTDEGYATGHSDGARWLDYADDLVVEVVAWKELRDDTDYWHEVCAGRGCHETGALGEFHDVNGVGDLCDDCYTELRGD